MGERLPYPTERDVLDAREEQLELRMDTAFPGRVQSYDPVLQVADVVPLIRKQVPQPDGGYVMEELPVLPCTPVCFPRMGPWFLSFPIAPGDTGLVIVCSGAIGHWRVGGGDVTDPGDLRRQHIAHSIFLPMGLVPRTRSLTQTGAAGATDGRPTGVVLGSDAAGGPRVLLRADGGIEIVAGGRVSIRSSATTRVEMQDGSQPFVRGTALADAADRHADAMVAVGDALGAALTAINTWVAGTAVLEAFPATPALHTALTTTLSAALSLFHAATAAWKAERAAYLSTRINGQ